MFMTTRATLALTCSVLFSALVPLYIQAQINPDAEVVGAGTETNPAEQRAAAWMRLEDGVTGTKNTDTRLAAVAGLSLLGNDLRAEKLIRATMHDSDIDVRLAAIVAAGEMAKNQGARSNLPADLRSQLNDPDPKVAFTAASTLWKINDPSGEDILTAVAEGERSADYTFWKESEHNASRTLHSPAALAKIGAQQGLLILVPPIGIGMGAYNYLKGPAGQSPQVIAITQLAKGHSEPVRHALIGATKVKNSGARLAAVEALARFSGADVLAAIEPLMTDSKENVRFSASAAYLRVGTSNATNPPSERKTR
jgi:HEAT repeat protein